MNFKLGLNTLKSNVFGKSFPIAIKKVNLFN